MRRSLTTDFRGESTSRETLLDQISDSVAIESVKLVRQKNGFFSGRYTGLDLVALLHQYTQYTIHFPTASKDVVGREKRLRNLFAFLERLEFWDEEEQRLGKAVNGRDIKVLQKVEGDDDRIYLNTSVKLPRRCPAIQSRQIFSKSSSSTIYT